MYSYNNTREWWEVRWFLELSEPCEPDWESEYQNEHAHPRSLCIAGYTVLSLLEIDSVIWEAVS